MDRVDGLGVVVTQQESTVSEYADRVAMLMRRADETLGRQATLLEAINCLGGLHDEYKPASLRKYFAALTWAVDAAVDLGQLGIEQEAVHREALSCRPRARPDDAPTRTSAKKRKNVTKDDLGKVCTFVAAGKAGRQAAGAPAGPRHPAGPATVRIFGCRNRGGPVDCAES